MKVSEKGTWFIIMGFTFIFAIGQVCAIFGGDNGEEDNGIGIEQEEREDEEGEDREEDD